MRKHEKIALTQLGFRVLLIILGLILVTTLGVYAQGSCASPDGGMLQIGSPPVDYNELETGGYCMNGTGSTSWHTMCFTFVPTVGDVAINMGYSQSCNNTSFGAFSLYDNSCIFVGSGLTFTGLTPGQTYTWCVLMRAWGGPSCTGFDRVCPYWMDNTPLPIELIDYKCEDNIISWVTASEIDNDYFVIKKVKDTDYYEIVSYLDGNGTTYTRQHYSYQDKTCEGKTFYQLNQVDYDGEETKFPMIECDCKGKQYNVEVLDAYNELGQIISPYSSGFKILKIKQNDEIIYKKIFITKQ